MTLRQANPEIYHCWKAMRQRCNNPNDRAYKNYGARGISVCSEWNKFESFCEWSLKNGHRKGLDIDRIDNNKGYSPDNCRWTDRRSNINNRRETVFITVNGIKLPQSEWAEKIGCPFGTIKGWTKKYGIAYSAERIRESMKNGYIRKNYSYGQKIPVKCVETGEIFESLKDAARKYCMSSGTLSFVINNGKRIKGLTFVKL